MSNSIFIEENIVWPPLAINAQLQLKIKFCIACFISLYVLFLAKGARYTLNDENDKKFSIINAINNAEVNSDEES